MRILILLILLASCAQAPHKLDVSKTLDTKPTETRPVPLVQITRTVYEYDGWVNYVWELTRRICRDFEVPVITQINLIDESPIIQNFQETEETSITGGRMVIYIAGQYDLSTCNINIWLRDPFNQKVDLYSLKGVLLHELMHHYYHHKGMSWPTDHNNLFNEEIKRLGWDKY